MLFILKRLTYLSGKNWRFGFFKVMTIIAMCPNVDTLVAKYRINQGKKWVDDNCHFLLFLSLGGKKQFSRCLGLCLRHRNNIVKTNQ